MPADRERTAEDLAEALLTIGGVGFQLSNPLTFKSGIVSPVYCDNRTFPYWPAQWRLVIEGFAALIEEQGLPAEVIAGIEAAGIPHSAALGYATGRPSVFVRKQAKEHGKRARIEGGAVEGKAVMLVEDLVTTGGSSLSGVEALRAEGAIVTDCLAIISYGFREAEVAFAAAGVRLHTLTNFSAVLRRAQERGLLQTNEVDAVDAWLKDPHGWAATRGLTA